MLGQITLFAPETTHKLRDRVAVELAPLKSVRQMIEEGHYLHRCRTGRQLNYAVYIDGKVDGCITYALPVVIAPIDGVPTGEVIEFARLYLSSNIPHTATCAIGKSLRRVRQDWCAAFPLAKVPRMVVSWSDTELHRGTIYRAANFQWLKTSKGDHRKARRTGCPSKWGVKALHPTLAHDKDCWVYRWSSDVPAHTHTHPQADP